MTASGRKRRSRPSLRARIGTYWLLALVLAALAGYGGYALVTAPAFRLQSLAVSGVSHVSRAEVVARAAIDPRANVWLLDRAAVRRRIEAIPYVASARVRVSVPAHVWLEIAERSEVGCVRERDGTAYAIDDALRVLERGCHVGLGPAYLVPAHLAAVPGEFLADPELLLLQDDAKALAAAGEHYRSFTHDAYGDLEATLADGITIKFGSDGDLERKQRLIAPILAELGPRAETVRAVDLRAPATPVVEYRAAHAGTPGRRRVHP